MAKCAKVAHFRLNLDQNNGFTYNLGFLTSNFVSC